MRLLFKIEKCFEFDVDMSVVILSQKVGLKVFPFNNLSLAAQK
jgi:hypothetical protein